MPKFTYTGAPNRAPSEILPDGDYLLEITAANPDGYCQIQKWQGAEQVKLKFKDVNGAGAFNDWLTFHEELAWKVDNCLTCFAYGAELGEIDVDPDALVSLRGWCRVGHYEKGGKTYNRIDIYYTDKEKFPREPVPAGGAIPAEAANPWD